LSGFHPAVTHARLWPTECHRRATTAGPATDPKVVSERLGYSKIGITLDTYSHVMPGMQEEAAQKIDASLRIAMQKDHTG